MLRQRPTDCVFFLTLPVDEDGFRAARAAGPERDFTWTKFNNWPEYSDRLGKHLASAAGEFERRGVTVERDASLNTMHRVFRKGNHSVATLFAHSTGQKIELEDGMFPRADVLSSVPRSWAGLLDFASCWLAKEVELIRGHAPRATVRASHRTVNARLMIHQYELAFAYLDENETNFIEALDFAGQALQAILSRQQAVRK